MKSWLPRSLVTLTLTAALAAPAVARPWKEKNRRESSRGNAPSHVRWERNRGPDTYDRFERALYERARHERARRERLERIIRARNEACRNERDRVRDVRRGPRGWIIPAAWGRDDRGRGRFECGFGSERPGTVRRDPRRWPPPIARDDRIRRDRRIDDVRRRSGNPCFENYPIDRRRSDRRHPRGWLTRVFQGDDGYPVERSDRNNRRRSDDCDLQDARDWLRSVQIGPRGVPAGQSSRRRNLVSSDPSAQAVAQRALRILQSSP